MNDIEAKKQALEKIFGRMVSLRGKQAFKKQKVQSEDFLNALRGEPYEDKQRSDSTGPAQDDAPGRGTRG